MVLNSQLPNYGEHKKSEYVLQLNCNQLNKLLIILCKLPIDNLTN